MEKIFHQTIKLTELENIINIIAQLLRGLFHPQASGLLKSQYKIHHPYFKFLQKEAQTGEVICIRLSTSLKH